MHKDTNSKSVNTNVISVTPKADRILYLDIARTLAIVLVVLCHATEGIYKMNLPEWSVLSLQSKIFRTSLFTIRKIRGSIIFIYLW